MEILLLDTVSRIIVTLTDTQNYLTVERDESFVAALKKVELCVAEVAAWWTKYLL